MGKRGGWKVGGLKGWMESGWRGWVERVGERVGGEGQ